MSIKIEVGIPDIDVTQVKVEVIDAAPAIIKQNDNVVIHTPVWSQEWTEQWAV